MQRPDGHCSRGNRKEGEGYTEHGLEKQDREGGGSLHGTRWGREGKVEKTTKNAAHSPAVSRPCANCRNNFGLGISISGKWAFLASKGKSCSSSPARNLGQKGREKVRARRKSKWKVTGGGGGWFWFFFSSPSLFSCYEKEVGGSGILFFFPLSCFQDSSAGCVVILLLRTPNTVDIWAAWGRWEQVCGGGCYWDGI